MLTFISIIYILLWLG
uniref:Uncharacterized protein n=1 Tax=Rhizophora mucronata TaxID=61149 RepID=A0A2P2PBC7_RHIMU